MAGFENRADLDRERLAAVVALIGPDTGRLSVHSTDPVGPVTGRAHGSMRPNLAFDVTVGRLFVVESFVVPKLSCTHDSNPTKLVQPHPRVMFISRLN